MTTVSPSRPSVLARALLRVLAVYRWTAAARRPRCRYVPTCSTYAVDAITVHGAWRGIWLAVRRVARCHPWNPGGVDPVPDPSPVIPGRQTTTESE